MAYSVVPTVATSDSWTASQHNTYIKDNFAAIFVGTTAGDTDYYTSATAKSRLAIGAQGTIYRSSGSAPTWLAKGSPGQVLTVNSAGTDIEYAYPKIKYAHVKNSGTQTIPATGSYLNCLWNTDVADADGWHNTSSNTERIIPTVAGDYEAFLYTSMNVGGAVNAIELLLYKNDTTQIGGSRNTTEANFVPQLQCLSYPISLNGSTDYINARIGHNNAGTLTMSADSFLVVKKVN